MTQTSPRNYPGSCSQREPKRPKGDEVKSSKWLGFLCGEHSFCASVKGLEPGRLSPLSQARRDCPGRGSFAGSGVGSGPCGLDLAMEMTDPSWPPAPRCDQSRRGPRLLLDFRPTIPTRGAHAADRARCRRWHDARAASHRGSTDTRDRIPLTAAIGGWSRAGIPAGSP
jgi:hypothetical protein